MGWTAAAVVVGAYVGSEMASGGDAPPPPAPSAQEQKLQEMQAGQIEKADLYNDLITPINLRNAGYKIVTDEYGTQTAVQMTTDERLASMSGTDRALYEATLRNMGLSTTGERLSEEQIMAGMTDSERRNYDLEKAYQERQQAALSGTLPVSPALEQQLKDEEATLINTLSMKLGPDWQLSTPGQKAISQMQQRHELLREEARRGQISTGEALLASRDYSGTPGVKETMSVGNYLDTMSGSTGNKLYSIPSSYSQASLATGSAMAPYQSERMNIYDNNVSSAMQQQANKAALYGSLISGGAYGYGAYKGAQTR